MGFRDDQLRRAQKKKHEDAKIPPLESVRRERVAVQKDEVVKKDPLKPRTYIIKKKSI